jgi:two-component system chemotaxis response regulator CheY
MSTAMTPRKRILVVEDDARVRSLLRALLEPAGYEVEEAGGGREALRIHRECPVDLVITDIFMPDGDGLEALQALDPAGGGPPVIAISAGSEHLGLDGLGLARALGAARQITKPFTPDVMLRAVGELLSPVGG